MSKEKIQELLAQLHDELRDTELDAKTNSMMQDMIAEFDNYLTADQLPTLPDSILERAKLMEIQFANKHPHAERAMREVIEILHRIGI